MLSIINLNAEFALDSVMEEDTRLDVHLVILIVPVGLEGDGDTIPAVGVDVTQAVAAALDNALGHHVGLLVQVDVVLVGVVERADGADVCDLLKTNLLGHRLESLQEHCYFVI